MLEAQIDRPILSLFDMHVLGKAALLSTDGVDVVREWPLNSIAREGINQALGACYCYCRL